MGHPDGLLGLSICRNKLYYALSGKDNSGQLKHVGCMELSYDLPSTIRSGDPAKLEGLGKVIKRLHDNFDPGQVRMQTLTDLECWATFPKLVYDDAGEREAHLGALIKGLNRESIEPYWFNLSNRDYRFLILRNRNVMTVYDKLLTPFSTVEYCSDFEIGSQWQSHTRHRGSFMTLSLNDRCLSAASFLLGKLRSATFIPYHSMDDLPYFWLQYASQLKWMKGLHEDVLVSGMNSQELINLLKPYLDPSSAILKMDKLANMNVSADEDTYGFSLEEAYPAIILSLGY
jgi:hypothetical protein